jgi:hypothetical protein
VFASRETERAMRQVQWQTAETDEATLDEGARESFLITTLPPLSIRALESKRATAMKMIPLPASRPSSIRWPCSRCTLSARGSRGCVASGRSQRGTWRCDPLPPTASQFCVVLYGWCVAAVACDASAR